VVVSAYEGFALMETAPTKAAPAAAVSLKKLRRSGFVTNGSWLGLNQASRWYFQSHLE
jgi:hypothetical protein